MKSLKAIQDEVKNGSRVGLTEIEKLEWNEWIDSFNLHAHASVLSRGSMKARWFFDSEAPVYLQPLESDDLQTVYINTCIEVSWLLLRVLPLCRVSSEPPASDEWSRCWSLLDGAFRASATERALVDPKRWSMLDKVVDRFFPFHPASSSLAELWKEPYADDSSGGSKS